MELLEAMRQRVSVRDYSHERVPTAELEAIRLAGEKAERLDSATLRFHLVENGQQIEREVKGMLGDYGKLIHAQHYIVVTGPQSEHLLLEAGYRFEQLILDATRRGWATCWIGGFFTESKLRRAMSLQSSEKVVALTPIGKRAGETSILHHAIRAMIKSSVRKSVDELFSWGVVGEKVPEKIKQDERWSKVLELTRRAPSWANKQPWRFVLKPGEVLLYKQEQHLKEGKDYHLVDCGIAMAHVHLTAKALGMAGEWKLEKFEVPGVVGSYEAIGRYVMPQSA